MCASHDYPLNESSDFWRYDIGVNAIPADTKKKITRIRWSEWQDKAIPEELYNTWKEQDAFSQGIAIIPGKVWHNEQKRNLYFTFVDADKQLAIQELCTRNGNTTSLHELAEKFLVEQHKDNPDRAHIYFYSPIPFPKKNPDTVVGLEVKGLGEHGIANCSPSLHEDGQPYEIIGTTNPITLTADQATELMHHIDNICKRHGIEYLEKHYKNLLDSNSKIYEGARHGSMISIANSLLFRYCGNGTKKSEDQLKQEFIDINNKRCEPPLPSAEIDQMWKDAVVYFNKNKDDQKRSHNYNNNTTDEDREDEILAQQHLTDEDISFVLNTISKEAPHDKTSILQLWYGMLSAFTKTPIPHNVNSKDPGSGKSYLLNLVSGYFPPKYVILLSGMSDKAILHRDGVMVREKKNTDSKSNVTGEDDDEVEPIAPVISDLELQIENLEEQIEEEKAKKESSNKSLIRDNKIKIKETEAEIKNIKDNAEKLIDLNNQIILILDTPQESLFNSLMSLMSQDTPKDQKYSFAEKSGAGQIRTKVNRLRGMPVLFTAQVIDDSRNERFAEKNRRFINVTPDTSSQKISTANNMIGLHYGCLPEAYDEQVVSRHDKERAKYIMNVLIAKLKRHSKKVPPKKGGIIVPFIEAITGAMPAVNDQVWSLTVTDRLMRYLTIITKAHIDSRPRLVNQKTGQHYILATFEDLKETLRLMERAAIGLRPYITRWFNDVFMPAFKGLDGKPNIDMDNGNEIARERHVGLTTEQLAGKTEEVYGSGRKPSNTDILYKYLYPLLNHGIIDKVQSQINGRQNIYFPVQGGEGKNLFSLFEDPNNLKLKVSNPDIFPNKKYIEESIRILSKRYSSEGVEKNKKIPLYKLVDGDGNEITPNQLVEKYYNNNLEDCFIKDFAQQRKAKGAVIRNISCRRQIMLRQQNYQIRCLSNLPNTVFQEQKQNQSEIQTPTTITSSSSINEVKNIFLKKPHPRPYINLTRIAKNDQEQSTSTLVQEQQQQKEEASANTIDNDIVSQNGKSNSNNNTRDIINTSDTLHFSQESRTITKFKPIVLLEDFYNTHESLDQTLPYHVLEQSPCYHIIGINNDYKIPLYYCKLHHDVESAHLETIEHHCRYKDPELHKTEILRLLKENEVATAAITNNNIILYSQIIVRNCLNNQQQMIR